MSVEPRFSSFTTVFHTHHLAFTAHSSRFDNKKPKFLHIYTPNGHTSLDTCLACIRFHSFVAS